MLKKTPVILLLFLVLQSCTHEQPLDKAKLDRFFVALNKHDESMGSIAMAENGKLIYQNAIGYSQINKDLKTPATVKTKYRVGSITKMFTAVMIFQLIEEGKLSLETRLSVYFPQVPNAQKITIAEMLGHRSGLHNITGDSVYTTYMTGPKSEAELIAIIAHPKPDFEPDTKFAYSNSNFELLGYIVEKLTGNTYAEELKKRITSKIGLADTYYGTKANPANNEAYSYQYTGQWTQMPETDMTIPGGAGAIVSTPSDLIKFIDALFAGKLISPANLAQMKTMKDHYGGAMMYGMGMMMIPFDDKKGFGHGGSIDGFLNFLVYFPDDKLAIAYTSNGVRYSPSEVIMGALNIYLDRPFAIPEFNTITLNTADLDKYVGKYSSTKTPLKIDIIKNNTVLFVESVGQKTRFPLESKGGDKFIYAGITFFQFDPAKKTLTVTQGKVSQLFTKTD